MKASVCFVGRYAAETTFIFAEQSELLALDLDTGSATAPEIHAMYSTESDPTARPLPFGSMLVAVGASASTPPPWPVEKTELAGGDYERGRALFFGEGLKCATCHRLRGEGGLAGPDLSNLVHRDAASVLRDIKEPNATINPDYVAYNVQLRDGGDLTGFVRDSDQRFPSRGRRRWQGTIRAPRATCSEMRPSAVSLMPSGLLEGLKGEQVRDLMTFLLHEPPTRSRAEVEEVLRPLDKRSTDAQQPAKPLNIVLVASKQDHGSGQHDYPAWQKKWLALFGQMPGITVTDAWEWPSQEQWRIADLMVFYFWNHDWSAERYQQLDDFQGRGGGMAVFHSATIADKEPEKLAERIGLAAQPGPTKYLHTPILL